MSSNVTPALPQQKRNHPDTTVPYHTFLFVPACFCPCDLKGPQSWKNAAVPTLPGKLENLETSFGDGDKGRSQLVDEWHDFGTGDFVHYTCKGAQTTDPWDW